MHWHWRDLSRSAVFLRYFHWTGVLAIFPPLLWFSKVEEKGLLGGFTESIFLSALIMLVAFLIQLKGMSLPAFFRYSRRNLSYLIFRKHRHGAPFSIYRRRR